MKRPDGLPDINPQFGMQHMKTATLVVRLIVAALAVCLAGGCSGRDKYPVFGKVTKADGQPVAKVIVEFAAIDGVHGAVAMTKEDGSYALSSDGTDDGAPPGSYRVRLISANEESDYNEPEDEFAGKRRARPQAVPWKYQNFDTSEMQFTVQEAPENRFDIVVGK
ncbi:MAG: carboxypeptidase regulatory-like domain-containing protein [Planctomycetes bacterium]|nr:carboxypeptidase regulatory-like domain-containing protein [Planctomycetota bacterium]